MARQRKKFVGRKVEKFNFRINRDIRVPNIRLVGDNLEAIGEAIGQKIDSDIYPTHQVLRWAQDVELDLVEISPKAVPPVCRIIDVKKFIYDRKKKEKELKAKTAKTVIKEIRFGPNTDDHDFDFKLRHAKKFLSEGSKVKSYVHFRGRTIVFKDRGELLLLRFLKELEEYGAAEALPKMEGRRMIVMISPKLKKKK
ncbi:MAG: translation initiation factor IF-3 [Saprospiraceae bacterium]